MRRQSRSRIPSLAEAATILLLLSSTYVSAATTTATTTAKTKAKSDKILLSRIRSLTLRQGQMTTSRRVSPIPQLKCVGGDAKALYDVDVMKCTNMDADYDDDDVSWSCEATLPHFFKLGATDVICEGYSSPDDPFVLKGSCGVEYILMLTEAGHKKFPKTEEQIKEEEEAKKKAEEEEEAKKKAEEDEKKADAPPKSITSWSGMIEFILWIVSVFGFFAFIAWRAYQAPEHPPGGAWAGRDGYGGGGGGGGDDGWGGGGGGDNWRAYRDEPPPSYDSHHKSQQQQSHRPSNSRRSTSGSYARQAAAQPMHEQWRPGFWTGAAAGAAASHLANNIGSSSRTQGPRRESYGGDRERERPSSRYSGGGGGPGAWRTSSYTGSSYEGESSSSYERNSTGFGQTRRR